MPLPSPAAARRRLRRGSPGSSIRIELWEKPCPLQRRWIRSVAAGPRPPCPADPPRTEEIIAVMRCRGDGHDGDRARGLIAVLWRAGLRIQEALDLGELDLDARRGSVLVRSGKGGRRREVGMDNWGFEQLEPWLRARGRMPVGPLFCVINGPSCGRVERLRGAGRVASARGPGRRASP